MSVNVIPESELSEEAKKNIADNKFFFGMRKFEYIYTLENYYDSIKDLTAKSWFIPLENDEIEAFYEGCKTFYEKKEVLIPEKLKKRIIPEIDKIISNEAYITQKDIQEKEVFIKLSSRSPKDFYYSYFSTDRLHPKFENLLEEEMKKLVKKRKEEGKEYTMLDDIDALNQAQIRIKKIKTGEEGIKMCLQSERIRSDLMKFLDFKNSLKLSIIIREWIPGINPHFEFRSFVFKNKLVAISQYCYTEFKQEIVDKKDIIENHIKDFFEKEVKERIKIENYVVDFALIKTDKEDSFDVKLLELNPYYTNTGACLFRWGQDKCLSGKGEFEFRILENPLENVYDGLPVIISSGIKTARKNVGLPVIDDEPKPKKKEKSVEEVKEDRKCIIQ